MPKTTPRTQNDVATDIKIKRVRRKHEEELKRNLEEEQNLKRESVKSKGNKIAIVNNYLTYENGIYFCSLIFNVR